MDKQQKLALSCAVLATAQSIYYSYGVYTGDISPAFWTWAMFMLGTSFSFWSYWQTKDHSLLGNIGNSIDVLNVFTILLSILFLAKKADFVPSAFDVSCIGAVMIIFAWWRVSSWHYAANLALQGVMTVAYFPTFFKLWNANHNTESFSAWSINLVVCVLALLAASDTLSRVYAARATILVSVVILLMTRIVILY